MSFVPAVSTFKRDGSQLHVMAMTDKDVDQLAGSRNIQNGETVRFGKDLAHYLADFLTRLLRAAIIRHNGRHYRLLNRCRHPCSRNRYAGFWV